MSAAILFGTLLALGSAYVVWVLRRPVKLPAKVKVLQSLPLPNGQSVQVDVNDPTDPMHDPAVRAMFAQVVGKVMSVSLGRLDPKLVNDNLKMMLKLP